MANLNQLHRMTKRSARRVGRGQGSKRGKTSGRGGKGQTARAGNKRRPELRDIIKKLPKRRGYGKNRARTVYALRERAISVPLARIEKAFDAGAQISIASLKEKGLIGRKEGMAKIVGDAASKKFTVSGIAASGSAKAAIEKAGGSVA